MWAGKYTCKKDDAKYLQPMLNNKKKLAVKIEFNLFNTNVSEIFCLLEINFAD